MGDVPRYPSTDRAPGPPAWTGSRGPVPSPRTRLTLRLAASSSSYRTAWCT